VTLRPPRRDAAPAPQLVGVSSIRRPRPAIHFPPLKVLSADRLERAFADLQPGQPLVTIGKPGSEALPDESLNLVNRPATVFGRQDHILLDESLAALAWRTIAATFGVSRAMVYRMLAEQDLPPHAGFRLRTA